MYITLQIQIVTLSFGGEDPWSREWQCTPVFLPGNSHGQKSPFGRIESDTTEQLTHTQHYQNDEIIVYLPKEKMMIEE